MINELAALRDMNLNSAIHFAEAPVLARGRAPNDQLLELIHKEKIPVLTASDRCTARLVMIHHPAVCQRPPVRPFPFRSKNVALVAHHPAADRDGRIVYDYYRACRTLTEALGCPPTVLPVGPAVRKSLKAVNPGVLLHSEDWPNMLNPDCYRRSERQPATDHLVVGRHARPDPQKWPLPETAALVYPDRSDLRFLMLGVDDGIRALFPTWPSNWQGLAFRPEGPASFLGMLDAYAYYHHPTWIEGFGYNVLEAMACGLPTLLSPEMEACFGPGPIYSTPEKIQGEYDRLLADPDYRADCGQAAFLAAKRFGQQGYAERMNCLLGADTLSRPRMRRPARPDVTLVVTSNGVGAGHIARQIAIAQAAPIEQTCVFFTLSQAAGFARRAGFSTESRPFHRHLNVSAEDWNRWFAGQLAEALQFYGPQALVFDGNIPYSGLLDALATAPTTTAIWVRRGMWRFPDESAAERSRAFDLIIEPGELAATADPGHAGWNSAPWVTIPIVLPVAKSRMLTRGVARRLLDLPPDETIVLLALGSGHYDGMAQVRAAALEHFSGTTVVELVNPLAGPAPEPQRPNHVQRTIFPLALYLAAFDAGVTAAGYNGFHEAIAAELPCLFVPNDAPEMDLQETRAAHAARMGCATTARSCDPYRVARGLETLADPDARAAMRKACRAVDAHWSGAKAAADLIALTARRNRSMWV